MQQRVRPPRPLGAPHGPDAPDPVITMLQTHLAQTLIEDRIRAAEAARIARDARPLRAAGAPRLRRPAWRFAGRAAGERASASLH